MGGHRHSRERCRRRTMGPLGPQAVVGLATSVVATAEGEELIQLGDLETVGATGIVAVDERAFG